MVETHLGFIVSVMALVIVIHDRIFPSYVHNSEFVMNIDE